MVGKTEQKFLDAALKIFAEKGYKGATTRLIAKEAGFSELTLFRQFENKENLFNKVLTQNFIKLKNELNDALAANQSEDPNVFLRTLITDIVRISENNFEFMFLANTQKVGDTGPLRADFMEHLSKHIEKNLPNREIDYDAFAISIYSYAFIFCQTKFYEPTFFNHDQALEGFIKNSLKLFALK
jgi:AcrR family transcriptional regulator